MSNNFRKLPIFICTIVLLGLNLSIANANVTDIDGHWAEQKINKILDENVAEGYEDGTFRPSREITRAEFVKMVNLFFRLDKDASIYFKDIKKDSWYFDYIETAVSIGYIDGYEDGTFRPNDKLTRQEAVKIVIDLISKIDNDIDKIFDFRDGKDVSNWARPYFEGALENKIVQGYEIKTIEPKDNITRAEAVKILVEITDIFLNVDIDNDGEPELNIDTDNDKEPELNIDTDNDKEPEINIDTDNDGEIDIDEDNYFDDITTPPTSDEENTTPPTIIDSNGTEVTVNIGHNFCYDSLATAVDFEGNSLDIEFIGNVGQTPGRYTITAIATDIYGNTSKKDFIVNVVDDKSKITDSNSEEFISMVEDEMLERINNFREEKCFNKLEKLKRLELISRSWSEYMYKKGYASEWYPNEDGWFDLIMSKFPEYGTVNAQNVIKIDINQFACDGIFTSFEADTLAEGLVNYWKELTDYSHDGILNNRMKYYGFGIHTVEENGRLYLYATQVFSINKK